MRSTGSWASSSPTPIRNSAGRSRGNVDASACSVATSPSSCITSTSLSLEGKLHVDAFMVAGPSRVGLKVCNVSIPCAPWRTAVGTARSGHCVRTCCSCSRTSVNTGHTFLRSSVHLMYSSGSISKARCLAISAVFMLYLIETINHLRINSARSRKIARKMYLNVIRKVHATSARKTFREGHARPPRKISTQGHARLPRKVAQDLHARTRKMSTQDLCAGLSRKTFRQGHARFPRKVTQGHARLPRKVAPDVHARSRKMSRKTSAQDLHEDVQARSRKTFHARSSSVHFFY